MDELELLTAVVAHPAEFEITLPGGLTMCRFDEDHYTVEYDHPTEDGEREWREKTFRDPRAAARFFVERRKAMKLGSDLAPVDDDDSEDDDA